MRNAQNQRGAMDDEEMVSTTWSVFPRMASCDTRGGLNVWDFGTPARSLAEMEALARVLSMHRIESGGGLVPLTREELRAAWVATHQR